MSASMAEVLRREVPRILDAWVEGVRASLSAVASDRVLMDHLPALLGSIAQHLAPGGGGEGGELERCAVEHAEQRRAAGFSLEQVALEYGELRRVLVRVLTADLTAASARAWEALHTSLDLAVSAAVTTYGREATGELEAERRRFREALQQEQEELRRAVDFRKRVLGIVSHDLRNPLNAIMLAAHTLLMKPDRDERERRTLRRITDSTDRAARLIRDLLDYSRAQLGGEFPIERRPGRMDDIVRQVLEEAGGAFPDREISLEIDPGADLEGSWDQDRVEQVLMNLVRNAIQHSLANTPVRVRLGASPDEVVIEVHNRGEPIQLEIMPTLFEAFKQGAASSPREGSVGLGLYIASEIVRGHRGRIEVESTREDGTTFRVHLPRQDGAQPGS